MAGDEETLLDIMVGGVAVECASRGVKSSSRCEREKHSSAAVCYRWDGPMTC